MGPGDLVSSGDRTTGARATGLQYVKEHGLGQQNPDTLVKSTKSTGRGPGGMVPLAPPGRGSWSSGKSASVPSFGDLPADPPGGRTAGAPQCGGWGRVQELKGQGERCAKAGGQRCGG